MEKYNINNMNSINLILQKKRWKHLLLLMGLWSIALASFAQNLQLSLPNHTVQQGDPVNVELTASNFDDMVSMQFSINWDPTVIEYVSSNEMDLDNVAVGMTESSVGNLRISWFDIEGVGETMDDGISIVNLEFVAIGDNGDSTSLLITDNPLEIQIFQDTGVDTIFQAIGLDIEEGTVVIEGETTNAEVSVIGTINNIDCNGVSDGAIDIVLVADGAYTFLWEGPNGFTSTEPDIDNLAGGDYELQVLDADGIIVLDTLFSIVQPLQALAIESIQADTTDCDKPNGTALIDVSGGTPPYSYDIGFGAINQNMMAGLTAGDYPLTVTDANDCTLTTSFTIASPSGFIVELGEDLQLCEGEAAYLESPEGAEYLWSTGETTAAISVEETGWYSLTLTDAFDCVGMDSVWVEYMDGVELVLENDSLSICPGDSIQLLISGADDYTWTTTETLNATNIPNPTALPVETTMYEVSGTNDCGEATLQVEVEVFEIRATAGEDTCVPPNTEVQLNASGGEFYYWIGGDAPLNNYNIANPLTTPEDSTTYSIMIVDENGCTTFDEVTVLVGSSPSRFVPHINLITPNGDNQNDDLYFGDLSKYGPNTLKIFNRWGDIVYDRINYQSDEERFDGTFKDKPLPAGTYYYVLSFREEDIQQTLTIVRE